MKTFFFLTDLPDEFTEDFSIEQIVRYGRIIDTVKKCSQLEVDQEQLKAMAQEIQSKDSGSVASQIDNFKDLYEQNLIQIKKMLIEFIADMDIHEVYKFVNLFPFLID